MSSLPPEWDAKETLRQQMMNQHLRSWIPNPQEVTAEHYRQAFAIAQQELTSLEQTHPGKSWVEIAQEPRGPGEPAPSRESYSISISQ